MKIANSRSARSEDGRRARIILDLGRGLSLRAISAGERCSVNRRNEKEPIMRDSSFQRIIGAIARPYTDVLTLLREQEILSPASEAQESQFVLDERIAAKSQEAILRIDPTAPHKVVEPMTASLYAASANLNTEGARPYIRLPSFPQASPYLILYFRGLASDIQHLVAIDMQVFSAGGLVRIEATGSPVVTLVTHSGTNGAPVTVPVTFTINAGYGAVLLKRVGETGFDWFGASLF